MTADDSIAWASVTPPKHKHRWIAWALENDRDEVVPIRCVDCRLNRADFEARQKRGRSSLRAGKDAERAIAKSYGGTRTGQFGGPDDVVVGELFIVQSKAGRGWFREAVWAELAKLTGSQRIPTLVISDRPGPGHKTRRYVIRTLEDDVALHGEKP